MLEAQARCIRASEHTRERSEDHVHAQIQSPEQDDGQKGQRDADPDARGRPAVTAPGGDMEEVLEVALHDHAKERTMKILAQRVPSPGATKSANRPYSRRPSEA